MHRDVYALLGILTERAPDQAAKESVLQLAYLHRHFKQDQLIAMLADTLARGCKYDTWPWQEPGPIPDETSKRLDDARDAWANAWRRYRKAYGKGAPNDEQTKLWNEWLDCNEQVHDIEYTYQTI